MKRVSLVGTAASLVLVLAWPGVGRAQDAAAAPVGAAPTVVAKVGDAVGRGAKAAAHGIERGAKATERGIMVGLQAAAHGIEVGALATARAASDLAKKIKAAPDASPAAGT